MSQGTLDALVVPVAEALSSVSELIAPDGGDQLLAQLGFTSAIGNPDTLFADVGREADALAGALTAVLDAPTDNPAFLVAVLELAAAVVGFGTAAQRLPAAMPTRLVDYLLVTYLRQRHPSVASALEMLGIVTQTFVPEADGNPDFEFVEAHWDRLPTWLSDPGSVLADTYGWGSDEVATDLLFERLQSLLWLLGITATTLEGDLAHELEFPIWTGSVQTDAGLAGVEVGLRLAPLADGEGISVVPYADGELDAELELVAGWTIAVGAGLATEGQSVDVRPSGVTINDASAAGDVEVTLRRDGDVLGPLLLIGNAGGTRLEVGELTLGAIASDPARFEIGLLGGTFAIAAGEGDSFLRAVLPAAPMAVDFELVIGAGAGGITFGGALGLELTIPIDRSIGGVVDIDALLIALQPDPEGLTLGLGANLGLTIGPFSARAEGIGLDAVLALPPGGGGNLGPLDLALGFAPPTRIGFAIESEAVHGGGFVMVEPPRYAGALSLDIVAVGIDAIVVVDTELPGDPDGWALFASLSARFPGIPLGFGFTLLGAGGLLALNRTMDAEALASGLRSGVIDSLLFPDDPVGDSAQLIAQIDDYFPLMADNTVIGPVVMLGWGSPVTLITAQLGVVLSLPDGVIAVMGSLEALLPVPEAPLLTLHMDSLGVVDVPAGTFALTASLYDSRLLETIDLGGDMAMYLCVAPQPYFLLSVGGYHPSFHPPSLVPAAMHDLRRMSASIVIADPISITIQSYFAVTSNSVQFGASVNVEASVEVWPTTYTARGWFEFDVLLIFSPFKIVADMSAGVGIYSGSKELMGVDLAAHIEGPEPWYASALASFKFFGLKVQFDLEVGGKAPGEPKPIAHPRTDALSALRSAGPWREAGPVDGPAAGITYVVPDDDGEDIVWVRPDHQLTARQSAAPLERTLEIVGQGVPAAGEELLHVTGAGLGDTALDPVPALDWFAPAQFEVLGQSEKLSRASFEEMDAGVTFGLPDARITARPDELVTSVDTGYEEETYTVPDDDSLANSVGSGATAIALSRAGVAGPPAFTIAATEYTLVRAADGAEAKPALADSGVASGGVSQYEALRARSLRIAADPGARSRMIVAPYSAALDPVPDLDLHPGPILEPVA